MIVPDKANLSRRTKNSILSVIKTGLVCVGFLFSLGKTPNTFSLLLYPSSSKFGWFRDQETSHLPDTSASVSKSVTHLFFQRFTLTPSANFLASLYGEGANLKPQNTAQGILLGFASFLSTTVIHFQR